LNAVWESSSSFQLDRHKQDACATENGPASRDACATENNTSDAWAKAFFDPYQEIEISRRNLPHWSQRGAMYFVTFRLADSLPIEKILQLQQDRKEWDRLHGGILTEKALAEFHFLFSTRVEQWLDSGSGSCCLAQIGIARCVAGALRHFDGERYRLDEWVVMPNHVHALVTPLASNPLSDILHSWKSFTANAINRALKQSGQLWQHETYDHIVRDERQLDNFRRYIRENPAKAGITVAQASSLKGVSGEQAGMLALRETAE
jgi:REP element-mobilizing transposase RayT